MASNLSLAEQETHLNMTADDRDTWHVYSDDPVMQRRLESVGAVLVRTTGDGNGKEYTLPANQLSLRKPPKPLSEERKAQLAMRMRSMRAAQEIMDAKVPNRASWEAGSHGD